MCSLLLVLLLSAPASCSLLLRPTLSSVSLRPTSRSIRALLTLDERWHRRLCSDLDASLREHSALYYATEAAWTEANLTAAAVEDACHRIQGWSEVRQKV